MAAVDYDEFIALAQELIAEAGRPVTFQVLSATPADANKPWKGPAAPTVGSSKDAPAVFLPPSGQDLGIMTLSAEMLARTQQVCLVAATADAFDFGVVNALLDGGVRWGVQWVSTLAPGPKAVFYALGVAR